MQSHVSALPAFFVTPTRTNPEQTVTQNDFR
eukprot:SAG31_NODE_43461_length_267_cov_0.613095_1_plen_30_part_10